MQGMPYLGDVPLKSLLWQAALIWGGWPGSGFHWFCQPACHGVDDKISTRLGQLLVLSLQPWLAGARCHSKSLGSSHQLLLRLVP